MSVHQAPPQQVLLQEIRRLDHVRAMNASTGYESGRPTKKDRREIGRLKGRD